MEEAVLGGASCGAQQEAPLRCSLFPFSIEVMPFSSPVPSVRQQAHQGLSL